MRNHCAQRALALATGLPLKQVHREHPPDTPFALLGTTPWRLARAARAYGRSGEIAWSLRPRALPPAPFAALVDVRHWGRRLPAAHWALVLSHDGETVRCAEEGAMPRSRFLRAWRVFGHASVTLHPQGKADPARAAIAAL